LDDPVTKYLVGCFLVTKAIPFLSVDATQVCLIEISAKKIMLFGIFLNIIVLIFIDYFRNMGFIN